MKEFHGIALTVDRRALIPRPETEELVDRTIAEVMARLTASSLAEPLRVIDVGTGSGAIAVAVAVALRSRRVPPSDVTILAVDVEPDALDLARENAVAHGVGDRVAFDQADLLPGNGTASWDIIVANLPYVRAEVVDALVTQRTSPAFEPRRSLDGGPDGLAVIGRLLDQLPAGLAGDGVALLEIGADQGTAIVELARDRLPGWSCVVHTDLAGLPRIARLQRNAGQPS
jgi:release factor glutamine methyltransferase